MNKNELEALIRKNDELYWNGTPEISDVEYDKLVEELRKIDPENDLVNKVNSENAVGEKVFHKEPMLSLNKVYSQEELKKWMKSVSRSEEEVFLIQPKYDGISGKLEDGILATRGNGTEGTNITDKLVMMVLDTSKKIDVKKDYMLGEIVITNSDFKNIYPNVKSKSGRVFKNSRNAVSGLVGNEDFEYYHKQGARLTFVDYDKNSEEIKMKDFDEKFSEIEERIKGYDYPMDGIVIKLKDADYGKTLGKTEHHPKNQIALKFTNESKITKLIDIEWGMGKDNHITAVAIMEPVDIQGVTISRASISLNEPSDGGPCIVNGDIAYGDIVTIERAGMVIPYIKSIVPHEGERQIIKIEKCPFCGSEIDIGKSTVTCMNPNCWEGKVRDVSFQLITLGIFGIGVAVIRSVMNKTKIDNLYDFLNLKYEDMEGIEGFGEATKQNILSEIERIKHVKEDIFLKALNIPNMGGTVAKLLLKHYSMEHIINSLKESDMIGIDGIGPITAKSVSEGLEKNREKVLKLFALFTFENQEEIKSEKGTICFTGKSTYKRSEMESIAREKGFQPVDSVNKDLTILVVADVNSTSSKTVKAKKLGIKIISEQEFFQIS